MNIRVTLRHPYILTIGHRREQIHESEWTVLMALMGAPVVSHAGMLEALWPGFTITPMDPKDVVRTHISSLRPLLEGHWRIVNIFNRGWYLERCNAET